MRYDGGVEMWDTQDVGCSRSGMFDMWDVRDMECWCGMFAGMLDVDLQNVYLITLVW